MIRHTFFDKCNTIIEYSEFNTGLNPVAELNTGEFISRILIHFNIEELRKSVKNNEINVKDLKHIIKMTNCGNVNLPLISDKIFSDCNIKERASSFDIIAFKLPYPFDEGKGFNYHGDYAKNSNKKTSKDGSNWFNANNAIEWDEYGVYCNQTLLDDLENKYGKTDDSVIIGIQHFDTGLENLDIDVSDFINNNLLNDIYFHGIGLAFSPLYEYNTIENRFMSFFTNHTNTFFVPYLETINKNYIIDNRTNFHLGCENKLYLFVTNDGEYINLDKLPKCTINDVEYDVKQNSKGIYYVDIKLSSNDIEPESILYDTWSDLVINGETIDDVEQEFVALPINGKISFNKKENSTNIYPQISGIKDCEDIKIGEIRNIVVDFIEEYSHGKKITPSFSEYRIYVKENDREIDVFDFQYIERFNDEHIITINTNDLIPNDYHMDIRIKNGSSTKYFENILEFNVVSNVTNFYI